MMASLFVASVGAVSNVVAFPMAIDTFAAFTLELARLACWTRGWVSVQSRNARNEADNGENDLKSRHLAVAKPLENSFIICDHSTHSF